MTAVCPPKILKRNFTGKYRVATSNFVGPNLSWEVGNEEVADFIVKEIEHP